MNIQSRSPAIGRGSFIREGDQLRRCAFALFRDYLIYHKMRKVHVFQTQEFTGEAENFQGSLDTVIEQKIAQAKTRKSALYSWSVDVGGRPSASWVLEPGPGRGPPPLPI